MTAQDLQSPRIWIQSISPCNKRRNTNDGISVIQTAEGATNEVSEILRMRESPFNPAGNPGEFERAYIQDEFSELTKKWTVSRP